MPDATDVLAQHIVATPGTAGGKPRIAGRRITVQQIAIWHERLVLDSGAKPHREADKGGERRARRRVPAGGPSSGKGRSPGGRAGDDPQVVGEDAPAHPPLHAVVAVIAAAVQLVPALEAADPPFHARAPVMAPPEPALPLVREALG